MEGEMPAELDESLEPVDKFDYKAESVKVESEHRERLIKLFEVQKEIADSFGYSPDEIWQIAAEAKEKMNAQKESDSADKWQPNQLESLCMAVSDKRDIIDSDKAAAIADLREKFKGEIEKI